MHRSLWYQNNDQGLSLIQWLRSQIWFLEINSKSKGSYTRLFCLLTFCWFVVALNIGPWCKHLCQFSCYNIHKASFHSWKCVYLEINSSCPIKTPLCTIKWKASLLQRQKSSQIFLLIDRTLGEHSPLERLIKMRDMERTTNLITFGHLKDTSCCL